MAFSLNEVQGWIGGRVVNADSLEIPLSSIQVEKPAPLEGSGARDVSFFFSREYERELLAAAPGILITGEPFAGPLSQAGLPFWKKTAVIACRDPYFAMAVLSEKFAPKLSTASHVPGTAERGAAKIHPSAVVHETAEIGAGVEIGANCVIESGARIGAGTMLYPGCFVGPKASIGEDSVLFPRVTVYEWVQVGKRARIHAGAVLGADGFGFAPKRDGKNVTGHQKIYHLGRVVLGDDVEIGANTCIDRGTFGDTVLGSNVKIDNLVQVGHNVTLGEGTALCGCAAMAGSSSTGKYVYVGGITGVSNKVHIGDGASVGALSLVTKDVPPGGTAVGNPQRDHKEHFKAHALLNRMVAEKKRRSE